MKDLIRYVKHELRTHAYDYLILLSAGFIFLLFLNLFRGYRTVSFILVSLFVGFYVLWGQFHHSKRGTIRFHHVVEYLLIGFTMLFLILLLIQ